MTETRHVSIPDIGDFRNVPVIEVLVKAGDAIEVEDVLIVMESDKATIEVPSPFAGIVREVKIQVGDRVSEGTLILVMEVAKAAGVKSSEQRVAACESPTYFEKDDEDVELGATTQRIAESSELALNECRAVPVKIPSVALTNETAGGEDVKLGAAAPRVVSPGQEFLAHFFAYPESDEHKVRELMEIQNPSIVPILAKRTCRWEKGTIVRVRARARFIHVESSEQRFEWNGSLESLDFPMRVLIDSPIGPVILIFDVFAGGLSIGLVCLTLQVSAVRTSETLASTSAYAACSAFASYASKDRSIVTLITGAIERSAGLDIFQDCLDLKAGDEWKPRLATEIIARDLFLLFWSRAASKSVWVEWEWKTALQDKGKDAFQIHPLQPDIKPPLELADLHFGNIHAIIASYYLRQ